ncbi:MAG: hypothetical protein AAF403_08255, partial [Pseudomonadota bacterium]
MHRLDITQYVVKTSVGDLNLKIDKGVSAGSQNLARQDFSFDVDQAWQAYIGGQVASLRTAYRIKVDKRYYTLDLGAAPIISASALASRIEFAIAADQTLGLLFKADSNGSDVTLKSKHIGGFKHLVEVDGVLGAPDLGVRSTLTQISSGMNAHILTLSGPSSLQKSGFASLRINDRSFVVELKAGSTLTNARDQLVKDMIGRGLSVSNVGADQIRVLLPSSETVKGAFHFKTIDDDAVTIYQNGATIDQTGHPFKLSGDHIMGGSGSDHLTGTSAGEFLAGGRDEGSTTISWKALSGQDSDVAIGVYQIDPDDPSRRIGHIIYGGGDDLSRDTSFVPFGGGGAVVENQYFVIDRAAACVCSEALPRCHAGHPPAHG